MAQLLTGKSAIITGASRGIGLAAAEAMAREGCNLLLVARDAALLEQARQRLANVHPVKIAVIACDLSQPGAAHKVVDACPDPEILVNNAGAVPSGGLESIDEATWRAAWDLKVFGYVALCRAIYPRLRARGGGVIINVIGDSGERPKAHYLCGSTANAALVAFTRALGEASPVDRIRVVGVNPGLTRTDRMNVILQARARDLLNDVRRSKEMQEAQRVAEPEQIADAILFLASAKAAHISGTILTVNGGMNGAEIVLGSVGRADP